jgi:hypothetical protein
MRISRVRYLAYSVGILAGLMIAIPVGVHIHRQYENQKRVDTALVRVTYAENGWREYFRAHKAWPDPLNDVIPDAPKRHLWYWRSRDGTAFVIDASAYMDDGKMHWYPGGVDLTGVVVWTTDGGESWHCGPYGGVTPSMLPGSCRESAIPAYTGPI